MFGTHKNPQSLHSLPQKSSLAGLEDEEFLKQMFTYR